MKEDRMDEIYRYMAAKLKEMYQTKDGGVVIERAEYMRIYKLICDLMQVRNIMRQEG